MKAMLFFKVTPGINPLTDFEDVPNRDFLHNLNCKFCTNVDGLEVFGNQSNRLPMQNGELLE